MYTYICIYIYIYIYTHVYRLCPEEEEERGPHGEKVNILAMSNYYC